MFKDYFGEDVDPAFSYAIASVATGAINFFVGYPYDMLKCRFQSANEVYKYSSVPEAFSKTIRNTGFRSLYVGSVPQMVTYCSFVAIQYTIYEKLMDYFKSTIDAKTYS